MKLQEANPDMKKNETLKRDKLQLNKVQDGILQKKYTAIKSIPRDIWQDAFPVPTPQRKKEFLEYLKKETVYNVDVQRKNAQADNTVQTSIGIGTFLISQIAYIRKRVYLVSLLVLAFAVIAADYAVKDSVGTVAALMPFIALCMVTESARSETYGMAELEMASQFSLKTIMLARFGTIGLVHMVLLCILIPIVGHGALISYIHAGIYLLVPYLAASVLECAAVRRFRGKEAISACMAISVMVSIINTLLRGLLLDLFGPKQIIVWILLAVYLTERTALEYRKMIYQTEEWIL